MGRWIAGAALFALLLGGGLVIAFSRVAQPATASIVAKTAAAAGRARAARCAVGFEKRIGTARLAYAAYAHRRTVVYRKPGRQPIATFGKTNVNGFPTVLGVLGAVAGKGCAAAWYRVELPLRPNGTVGYVRAADVGVETVGTRLEVDLSARRLTLYRSGHEVMHATVAIGKLATPTPIGRFYVNQRLRPTDSSGPYGPAAIGVSAFSNVLTGWTQGGPIGIHGTNEPELIGQRVSNGCIRLRNSAIARLFPQVVAGTPVVIHP